MPRRLSPLNDPHGCYADYEAELIAEAQWNSHLANECRVGCDYCRIEEQIDKEAMEDDK